MAGNPCRRDRPPASLEGNELVQPFFLLFLARSRLPAGRCWTNSSWSCRRPGQPRGSGSSFTCAGGGRAWPLSTGSGCPLSARSSRRDVRFQLVGMPAAAVGRRWSPKYRISAGVSDRGVRLVGRRPRASLHLHRNVAGTTRGREPSVASCLSRSPPFTGGSMSGGSPTFVAMATSWTLLRPPFTRLEHAGRVPAVLLSLILGDGRGRRLGNRPVQGLQTSLGIFGPIHYRVTGQNLGVSVGGLSRQLLNKSRLRVSSPGLARTMAILPS